MKTISRPVINRLPVDVNQLDEFACRQLDKVSQVLASFFLLLSMLRSRVEHARSRLVANIGPAWGKISTVI